MWMNTVDGKKTHDGIPFCEFDLNFVCASVLFFRAICLWVCYEISCWHSWRWVLMKFKLNVRWNASHREQCRKESVRHENCLTRFWALVTNEVKWRSKKKKNMWTKTSRTRNEHERRRAKEGAGREGAERITKQRRIYNNYAQLERNTINHNYSHIFCVMHNTTKSTKSKQTSPLPLSHTRAHTLV